MVSIEVSRVKIPAIMCFLIVCQSPGVQGEKIDRLLKEEALRNTPETNESQERWGVSLEGQSPSSLIFNFVRCKYFGKL